MSLTKLSLGEKKLNYSRPGRVWSVTSRLGTGKRLTLFYSVHIYMNIVNCNILTTKCAVNMYLACHENYIWKSLIHSDDSFSIVLFAFDELLFCIVSLFVFYCTVLYCIILYCILFYCIRTRFHEKEKGRCRLFVIQVDQKIFLSMFNIRFFLFTFSLYVFKVTIAMFSIIELFFNS